MPIIVSTRYVQQVIIHGHTVPLDPELALRYALSTSVYVYFVMCERYDMAYFELVFVVV
jgi:hypothetical protein